jgi:DNA-binding transcriptional MocR family regulator
LAAAIEAMLPDCVLPVIPGGGVHLWLRLPDRYSDVDVADHAAARGLALSPGRMSFPSEPSGQYLRLSYSAAEPPALVRAVQILADILAAGPG